MPENAVIGRFERRLVELGCPVARAHGKAQELADHHADLKEAALEDGMPPANAEQHASAQLGNPSNLAEYLAWTMRQSSWWGRHPILGFCVLPLVGFIPIWIMCGWALIAIVWLTGHLFGPAYLVNTETAHALALDPTIFASYSGPVNIALNGASSLLMTLLFCAMAQRSVSGLKWMTAVCAACSAGGAFSRTEIVPGSIAVAWVSTPNWICASLPWLMAGMVLVRHWLVLRRLPALVSADGANSQVEGIPLPPLGEKLDWTRKFLTTPTYWISTPLLVAIVVISFFVIRDIAQGREELLKAPARLETLRQKTWPAESAAVTERLKSRNQLPGPGQSTVDLLPWVNVSLTPAEINLRDPAALAMSDLPLGIHIYDGTLFDVSGKVQLMGHSMLENGRLYPVVRKGMPIHQKCRRILLLHGAEHVKDSGTTIAKLVLHYVDGSSRELPIVSGEQVLDCWGPIYTTPAMGEQLEPKARGTELAWAGTLPEDVGEAAWLTARIYRTAFPNPQPDVEISSVDYVSTLTDAAPFLLGVTIDK